MAKKLKVCKAGMPPTLICTCTSCFLLCCLLLLLPTSITTRVVELSQEAESNQKHMSHAAKNFKTSMGPLCQCLEAQSMPRMGALVRRSKEANAAQKPKLLKNGLTPKSKLEQAHKHTEADQRANWWQRQGAPGNSFFPTTCADRRLSLSSESACWQGMWICWVTLVAR
eukprot:1160824-Pelagomonas_calceolata.AAC.12